ncbi:MAG: aspartyl/asparaginyl beta-hydroxylase domain-containing protein [Chitinophagales bacterium]
MKEKAIFFLDETATYNGPEPYFYERTQFEWVSILEENWQVIRDEMQEIISGKEEITLSSINPPYLSRPGIWKNIYFLNFMWKYHSNCKKFPKTYSILKSIPNLTFAEFTALEPHSRILPHIGETNTTIRGHLGISIPASFPTMGIKVGNEERGWEEGKVVLFSDCHRHTVWNNSDQRRFVLVFDITRNEFSKKKYWVSAQSLSALTIKFVDEKIGLFKRLPTFLLKASHQFIALGWYLYLPIQRNLGLP